METIAQLSSPILPTFTRDALEETWLALPSTLPPGVEPEQFCASSISYALQQYLESVECEKVSDTYDSPSPIFSQAIVLLGSFGLRTFKTCFVDDVVAPYPDIASVDDILIYGLGAI